MVRGVRRETVGSGMVRKTRNMIDLNEADPEIAAAAVNEFAASWRWDRSLRPLIAWLDTQLPALSACPGHDDVRCCGRWQWPAAEGWPPCRGGKWRELEDLEWYIQDVHQRVGYLRAQVECGDTVGAAIFGVELGAAILQLQLKQGPEAAWLWGRDMKEKLGNASATRRKHSAADRCVVVRKYLNDGKLLKTALHLAAEHFGVTAKTIERDWYKRNDPRPGD